MKKIDILVKVLIIILVLLNYIVFLRVKNINQANITLENEINSYLDLKEKVDLYNNILDNANILEKNAKELEEEKNKVEQEVLNLTLEINNLEEKIKKLK